MEVQLLIKAKQIPDAMLSLSEALCTLDSHSLDGMLKLQAVLLKCDIYSHRSEYLLDALSTLEAMKTDVLQTRSVSMMMEFHRLTSMVSLKMCKSMRNMDDLEMKRLTKLVSMQQRETSSLAEEPALGPDELPTLESDLLNISLHESCL